LRQRARPAASVWIWSRNGGGWNQTGNFDLRHRPKLCSLFWQALKELEAEGGVAARAARFAANQRVLIDGMTAVGFEAYLAPEYQSSIVTSLPFPTHRHFDFNQFYQRLSELGFMIYPGKVSDAECFRIGTIGHPGGLPELHWHTPWGAGYPRGDRPI
jgi:2-aminoethylphosphonate-pyruvate transaminase